MAVTPDTSTANGRLSAADRVARNRRITEARAAGMPWAAIAARFGVSERTARRAEREHVASVTAEDLVENPAAVLAEAIRVHRWALDELRDLTTTADNSSAAVGAIRSRVATARDLIDLLGRAGLIPAGPYAWAVQIEMHAVATAVLDVAERHGLATDEIVADLEVVPGMRPAVALAAP